MVKCAGWLPCNAVPVLPGCLAELSAGSTALQDEGMPYGRVSLALSSAAAQAQAAAEAGPQTDTQLFSTWESHTRGLVWAQPAGACPPLPQ